MRVQADEHHEITISASITEWRNFLEITEKMITHDEQLSQWATVLDRIKTACDCERDDPPWRTTRK